MDSAELLERPGPVEQVMLRNLITAPPRTTLLDAEALMPSARLRHLVVASFRTVTWLKRSSRRFAERSKGTAMNSCEARPSTICSVKTSQQSHHRTRCRTLSSECWRTESVARRS